ncbi:MAG: contractile injection system protein, VgrG/Pvc8 family [Anaerolineae bacterium]|jgi:phage protein D|nr:contractile injection system protein, VgrG/Pvc8 family [Anaerolineae bacterium]
MSIEQLVPDFAIKINGAPFTAGRPDLISLAVNEKLDTASIATFTFVTWDTRNNELTWIDDSRFKIGNTATIELGYVDALEPLIDGEITGLEASFAAGGTPTFTVIVTDMSHRLLRHRRSSVYLNMKDSAIASQIASGAGLSAMVDDTVVTLPYVYQNNMTDMSFLLERALRIGYEVFVIDKKLYFNKRSDSVASTTLAWNTDLLEFSPSLYSHGQVKSVQVRGWDYIKKEAIVGQSSAVTKKLGAKDGKSAISSFGEADHVVVKYPVSSKAEADKMAQGILDDLSLEFINAIGMCYGNPQVRMGKVVTLSELGTRFSGDYYITSATHHYSPKHGYRTTFNARRNASGK